MFKTLKEDIEVVLNRDLTARNKAEVIYFYLGLHALWLYRRAHFLWR
jgi:serine O-acetyltransferase